jgi:hypothetical protein
VHWAKTWHVGLACKARRPSLPWPKGRRASPAWPIVGARPGHTLAQHGAVGVRAQLAHGAAVISSSALDQGEEKCIIIR